MKRLQLTPNNFMLLDFEDQVYLQVIHFSGKAYVKELSSLDSVKQVLQDFLI